MKQYMNKHSYIIYTAGRPGLGQLRSQEGTSAGGQSSRKGQDHSLTQFDVMGGLLSSRMVRQADQTCPSRLRSFAASHLIRSRKLEAAPADGQVAQGQSPGFTLLECLISLGLSLLILISALEISTQARRVFFRLKETQESSLAAAVALEKIRQDLETAGAGIPSWPGPGNFSPLLASAERLIIFSAEVKTVLLADAEAGQDFLLIELIPGLASKLRKGRALFLADGVLDQLTYVAAVSGNRLSISPALSFSFAADRSQLLLLEKIEIYPDHQQKILRRRINDTSGQPLIEDVISFGVGYTPSENLAVVKLTTACGEKSHDYELVLYPKNLGKS
ncbi:MAG: hypothetical protein NUW07_02190 [Candidatus Saccharicenans sp.]|jgi:type II secretory pathway pseudopilin PulG|nr:hypothetical protein [Candidatus Saccharicenans sp.]MDH7494023.1 hypothetical protein [Candidatus Saccharicenans sp.]